MDYYCEVDSDRIIEAIINHEDYDTWGEVEYGDDERAVDYNICIDNSTEETEYCSAFYRIYNKNGRGLWQHDGCQEWYAYEIDFNDENWEAKLKEAAEKAFEKLWLNDVYGTSARCPKCGKQLFTSDVDGYGFMCKECDENFYTVEVKENMADYHEINVPMTMTEWENNLSDLKRLSKKFNCDFLGYDNVAGLVDIGWSKCFPESEVLNEIVKKIKVMKYESI